MRYLKGCFLLLLLLLLGPLYQAYFGGEVVGAQGDWQSASRDSTGLAPLPADYPGAVIQIYAARTYSWRGHFAVHTWVATKAAGADSYLVHQVIGFRKRQSQNGRSDAHASPPRPGVHGRGGCSD